MKINIYYGGRGLIEDPTIYVINKITDVLKEIRVDVARYNLYEQKGSISMLPNTLKDVDAVVLAVSVEWYGIGGLMQQFLDACWMYADKNKLKKLYMFPVVISTSFGERDAEFHLTKSWELLGGVSFPGICAYAEEHVDFETNAAYAKMIEQAAENMYRAVNRKAVAFPSSILAGGVIHSSGSPIDLTPQESEQLSELVSNDSFVKQQKEDVEKLAKLYMNKLDQNKDEDKREFIAEFKKAFVEPEADFAAVYQIMMTDTERDLVIEISEGRLKVYYGTVQTPDVLAKTTREIINKLVNGRVTFQGAFMSSQLTCKGDFKLLRSFDQIFRFE